MNDVSLRENLNSIFQFAELKNTTIIHYSLFIIHFSAAPAQNRPPGDCLLRKPDERGSPLQCLSYASVFFVFFAVVFFAAGFLAVVVFFTAVVFFAAVFPAVVFFAAVFRPAVFPAPCS